jgi:hypothetical protein
MPCRQIHLSLSLAQGTSSALSNYDRKLLRFIVENARLLDPTHAGELCSIQPTKSLFFDAKSAAQKEIGAMRRLPEHPEGNLWWTPVPNSSLWGLPWPSFLCASGLCPEAAHNAPLGV